MEALKPKIAVVAGELRHPRFLNMFEPLREAFDVTVYVLENPKLLDHQNTGLKIRVFENITDMPGYLRGLEEELASVNFILGLETSRLGTFQAVRAARKHNIPMGVVVTEFHPYFYERYSNIRAIQFDICNKSERFYVTSKSAGDTLRLDSVPSESIRVVGPVVDKARFRANAVGRKKFRDYVGVKDDEFVVLFHHELEVWNRPEVLIDAVALLVKRLGPSGHKVRALFAGSGSVAKDLKYRAFDRGLGKQIMFLHQDPEPFIADLYAASDLQFVPRALRTEFHEDFPLPMLEGMAVGLVPVVGAGALAAELAGDGAYVVADDSHQALAAVLQTAFLDAPALTAMRAKAQERIDVRFSDDTVRELLVKDIQALLAGDSIAGKGCAAADFDRLCSQVRDDLTRGAEQDALLKIEEALLIGPQNARAKAEIHCLRGEAFYGLGDIENAMQSYSEAMRFDDRDHRSLRGLGFVAWQGHSNEDALVFFKKAIAIKEDDAQTMLGIGLVHRRLGLTEEALFWLEKCVLSPVPPPSAFVLLAQACAQIRTPARGIKILERVMDAVGDRHTLMMTLGQLYLNDGKTEEGNAILQKALSGDGSPAA